MSGGLWVMAAGVLARDPERRTGAKSEFVIATVRVGVGDDVQWVSVMAFSDAAERLLQLKKGDPVSVAGRCELRSWRGQDGTERHGLSIVATEIGSPRPRPRRRAPRRPDDPRGEPNVGDGRPFDDELGL